MDTHKSSATPSRMSLDELEQALIERAARRPKPKRGPALNRLPYYTDPHEWPGRLLVQRSSLISLGSVVYGASTITDLLIADMDVRSAEPGDSSQALTLNTCIGLGYALAACLSSLAEAFDAFESQPAHEAQEIDHGAK